MACFLFVVWDGAGAVTVEARLVRSLVQRGRRVIVVGPVSTRRYFQNIDCEFTVDPTAARYDAVVDYPADELTWLRDNVWFGGAPARARFVVKQAARTAADVVVCDWLVFAAMAAAEAYGRPSAILLPGLYGLTIRPRELDPDHPYRRFWEAGLPALNTARSAVGLSPMSSVFDQADALDRLLVLTVRDFDEEDVNLPKNACYVGPQLEPAGVPEIASVDPGNPRVLVSFSTSNMDQQGPLQRVLEAVARLPVRAVLTAGPAVEVAALRVPDNAAIHQHVQHTALLPQCSAVVTHAGHGTVIAALAHGVPLVCMPMGRDQFRVAARVEAIGAGVSIDVDSGAPQVAEAIRHVLSDPSYREAAVKMQRRIATGEASTAVSELEALAGTALVGHHDAGTELT